MSQGKRLLFYIALNVVVSAVTTLAVLWIWGRANQPPPTPPVPTLASPSGQANPATPVANVQESPSAPAATLGPNEKAITITNVYGVGSLQDEVVVIKNVSQKAVLLTGWRLDDGKGDTYTFPSLTLNDNGAVQVHTTAGTDTVIDLYWGRDAPVWHTDDIVTLLDAQGNIRATYQIR
jgi:hypothetical protein